MIMDFSVFDHIYSFHCGMQLSKSWPSDLFSKVLIGYLECPHVALSQCIVFLTRLIHKLIPCFHKVSIPQNNVRWIFAPCEISFRVFQPWALFKM